MEFIGLIGIVIGIVYLYKLLGKVGSDEVLAMSAEVQPEPEAKSKLPED